MKLLPHKPKKSIAVGTVYFDTYEEKLKVYDGNKWFAVDKSLPMIIVNGVVRYFSENDYNEIYATYEWEEELILDEKEYATFLLRWG